ncbi:MAG: PaaI family thioesterase, partial [Polyangiaceae bacterium]
RSAVGLENATTFLKAVRDGTLTGRATPLTRGRRTQVWEVRVTDDDDRLVAQGRVRMLCLEGGAEVAGETVAVKT